MALKLRSPLPVLTGVTEWVGEEMTNEKIQGKPVLVHFWSVSCGMCHHTFPELIQLREEQPDLCIIGIHMPRSEADTDVDKVKNAITRAGLKHSQGIDNQYKMVEAFENRDVPAFFLFDATGVLRFRSAGEKALGLVKKPLTRVLTEYTEQSNSESE